MLEVTILPIETAYPMCATLREKRTAQGWTQLDVTVRLQVQGLSKINSSHISGFERGLEKPWPRARHDLALLFGISEAQLFPELSTEA
jgi:transcriptional regulator with XRE-family HTH domain